MAIEYIGLVLKCQAVKGATKLVLLGLADCANDAGVSWPGIRYLAQVASLSDHRHLLRRLDHLEDLGFIARHHRPGRSTVYTVNRAALEAQTRGPQTTGPQTTRGPQTTTTHGPQTTPPMVCRPPDPSGNRQEEPSDARETETTLTPVESEARWSQVLALYPNKSRTHVAHSLWVRDITTADLADRVQADIQARLAAGWVRVERRFIPTLATYLEERRWEDAAQADVEPPEVMKTVWECAQCGESHVGWPRERDAGWCPNGGTPRRVMSPEERRHALRGAAEALRRVPAGGWPQ